MEIVIHKSKTRGHANYGFLDTYYTFSFAEYYERDRAHFGALRVLNDDTIAPGTGFGIHPHDNMEIISIPLEGKIEHKDSINNTSIISAGDIQVMSAGSGIKHSEKNSSNSEELKLLQIWVFPNKQNVYPRYDQITLDKNEFQNKFKQIVSPNIDDEGLWIHQNAWLNIGEFDSETIQSYKLKEKNNGVYLFMIDGNATIERNKLFKRDGIGIWDIENIEIKCSSGSKILLIEVPMRF